MICSWLQRLGFYLFEQDALCSPLSSSSGWSHEQQLHMFPSSAWVCGPKQVLNCLISPLKALLQVDGRENMITQIKIRWWGKNLPKTSAACSLTALSFFFPTGERRKAKWKKTPFPNHQYLEPGWDFHNEEFSHPRKLICSAN